MSTTWAETVPSSGAPRVPSTAKRSPSGSALERAVRAGAELAEQVHVVVELGHVPRRLLDGDRVVGDGLVANQLALVAIARGVGRADGRQVAVPPFARLRCRRCGPTILAVATVFKPVVEPGDEQVDGFVGEVPSDAGPHHRSIEVERRLSRPTPFQRRVAQLTELHPDVQHGLVDPVHEVLQALACVRHGGIGDGPLDHHIQTR